MTGLSSLLLSVMMLAVGGLLWGGLVFWRRADRTKGALMLVAALVLLANVLILTL